MNVRDLFNLLNPLDVLDPEHLEWALVRLWHACGEHAVFQHKLDRLSDSDKDRLVERCETAGQLTCDVAPSAALHVLDQLASRLRHGDVREKRPRKIEVCGQDYWLLARPPGWESRYSEHRPNFHEHWMRAHQILPACHKGIDIEIVERSSALEKSSQVLVGGGSSIMCVLNGRNLGRGGAPKC